MDRFESMLKYFNVYTDRHGFDWGVFEFLFTKAEIKEIIEDFNARIWTYDNIYSFEEVEFLQGLDEYYDNL